MVRKCLKSPKNGQIQRIMEQTKDRALLERLHKAASEYFKAENEFRRNACGKTWDAKVEADRIITITMSEVGRYLHETKK